MNTPCKKCKTEPTVTTRKTPEGMRAGVALLTIQCPTRKVMTSGYDHAKVKRIWNDYQAAP